MGDNGPKFVSITPEHLYELCKDKCGELGKAVWDFYANFQRRMTKNYPRDTPAYIFHDSAFTDKRKSEFQIRGLISVPDRELQEMAYSLSDDIDLTVKKYHNSDKTWNLVLSFELKAMARDKSPPRKSRQVVEDIPLERKRTTDKPKPTTSFSSSRSNSRERVKSTQHSVSEESDRSDSESPQMQFRRSKTPMKSRSRSKSVTRNKLVKLGTGEAEKLRSELAKRDALLVQVEPVAPAPKVKRFGLF